MGAGDDGLHPSRGGHAVDAQSGQPVGRSSQVGQAMVEEQTAGVTQEAGLFGCTGRPVPIGKGEESRLKALCHQPLVRSAYLVALLGFIALVEHRMIPRMIAHFMTPIHPPLERFQVSWQVKRHLSGVKVAPHGFDVAPPLVIGHRLHGRLAREIRSPGSSARIDNLEPMGARGICHSRADKGRALHTVRGQDVACGQGGGQPVIEGEPHRMARKRSDAVEGVCHIQTRNGAMMLQHLGDHPLEVVEVLDTVERQNPELMTREGAGCSDDRARLRE